MIFWILAAGFLRGAPIVNDTSTPVRPGAPGIRPFWNVHARRFIYAPAFDLPAVPGAASYRFTIRAHDQTTHTFTADKPTSPLSPVWNEIAEGYTTLTVQALDSGGKPLGSADEKAFYRSAGFVDADIGEASMPYREAGRLGLKGLYDKAAVQYWLVSSEPDKSYARYCYPNKIIGGLVRAMSKYSTIADDPADRRKALQIAKRAADYLLSLRLPKGSPYADCPPTYALDVDHPLRVAVQRVAGHWFLVPSAMDAAFGLLDLYDATHDAKYFNAAKAIADAFAAAQQSDGTWPLMVNDQTGKPISPQRLIPTWVIFFFDRLDHQYHLENYRAHRARAWQWIADHPLSTYQWDAQFEDIKLRGPYENLAREQACDTAMLLMSDPSPTADQIAQAEALLRFAEDQFVVWSSVTDVQGWRKAMPDRRKRCQLWITPCVLEQYACYDPVARSSAVLIDAYLKAHEVTHKPVYLAKARALANGLLAGQKWLAESHDGNNEFPTWNMRIPPINWLNNSFYAADAILNIGKYDAARFNDHK